MLIACHRHVLGAAFLLLFCSFPTQIIASTITTAPTATATSTSISNGTCEFRTINYITDTLPQQCLRSSWSQSNATLKFVVSGSTTATIEGHTAESSPSTNPDSTNGSQAVSQIVSGGEAASDTPITTTSSSVTTSPEIALISTADVEAGELNGAAFLSFEEWKKQTLEKAGQANTNIGNRRSGENKRRDSASFQNDLDTLGDEGEIDLDFGAFGGRGDGEETAHRPERGESKAKESTRSDGGPSRDHYRSKDAGKTCKERFSYASFDAGATILKTHSGAKHSKAVLIENKDSYMLSECSTENKFIIIELSEDIWIDTLVLANYEFFSSMIRTFRVSVSDRYPVKVEKWKDIGTYEARNSREIQAFLIENPQIWARYLRIEFLSHYGNEYYCPLSLVRVHGTRMLESWKESEANDEENEGTDSGPGERFVPEAIAEVVREEERQFAQDAVANESNKNVETTSQEQDDPGLNATQLPETNVPNKIAPFTPWEKDEFAIFKFFGINASNLVCLPADSPSPAEPILEITVVNPDGSKGSSKAPASPAPNTTIAPVITPEQHDSQDSSEQVSAKTSYPPIPNSFTETNLSSNPPVSPATTPTSIAPKPHDATASQRAKTTSTSSASTALPTIQESFFKAVSRRLQLLESNSTLSLQYIEEQSRALREAFSKVEKKQLQKTTVFLDTLNSTVFDQLHGFRQQYDEIWQSTIISLESQRDESRREILAISTRLNILADEVIFQKRMTIVQSVLLLLCLGLVIFSRVAGGSIDFPRMHSRSRYLSDFQVYSPLDSPPDSPYLRRGGSVRAGRRWLETGHRRQQSDETVASRSRSRDLSPPTPISTYSQSAVPSLSPPLKANDIDTGIDGAMEHLDVPAQPSSLSSSPRTPKKRKRRAQQSTNQPSNKTNDNFTSTTSSVSYADSHSAESNEANHFPSRSTLPSPPPEEWHEGRNSFSIARKPLPALPVDGG